MNWRALKTLPLVALCTACGTNLPFGTGGSDTTWELIEIDGEAFPARATLTFEEEGVIAGLGPCNQYRAAQPAKAPKFDPGPITVTRAACPDGSLEVQYLFNLSRMSRSQITGNTLVLSDPAAGTMVFKADG